MTLLSLLLSSLFFWYRHLTEQKGGLEALKRPLAEERYLYQRLRHILPKAEAPLFTEGCLIFRFDRGLYKEPSLSEKVLAKLYHDESARTLYLGIWPDPTTHEEKTPFQTFTLLENVDEVGFEFYSPPDPFENIVDPEEVGVLRPLDGWQGQWIYESLPAMIRIYLTRGERKQMMCFDLDQPIIYPVEGT